MFGIGMPEMILILALALIVVGPDKLPDLARSMAKGLMELKKTAEGLKASFDEEANPLDEVREDLEDASKSLKNNILDLPPTQRDETTDATRVYPPAENAKMAYAELLKRTSGTHASAPDAAENTEVSPPGVNENAVHKPVNVDRASAAPETPQKKTDEKDQ